MGLTCASLHIFSASKALEARALAENLLAYELTNNLEEAELELIAVAAAPWISFFDLTNPPAITEASMDFGKQFSAGSGGPVLLTSVFDSDGFAFVVFEQGRQVDAHASMPGLLPGRMKKWPPAKRATEWSRLFNRPIEPKDVQALTEEGVVFAEDSLARLCELVGLSRELAMQAPQDLRARP